MARRQSYRLHMLALQDTAKCCAECAVAVHQEITLAIQEAILEVRQFTGDLLHPGSIRIWRASSEMDTSRLQLHDKQQIIRDQSALGPDLDRRKVDGSQYVPVSLEEGTP